MEKVCDCEYSFSQNLASYLPYIVWGAKEVDELKIIHRLKAPDRFLSEAIPMLNQFAENSTPSNEVTRVVSSAMKQRIGTSLKEVLSWFERGSLTRGEVVAGFKAGEVEGENVCTLWGIVQGVTSFARKLKHTDARISLERRIGRILSQNS